MSEDKEFVDEKLEQTSEWQRYLDLKQRSKEHLGAGIGLGALSVAGAAAVGAVCPMCVVAVPALIGSGLWNRHKTKKALEEAQQSDEVTALSEPPEDGHI